MNVKYDKGTKLHEDTLKYKTIQEINWTERKWNKESNENPKGKTRHLRHEKERSYKKRNDNNIQ